jgi:HlyD family secretion protein
MRFKIIVPLAIATLAGGALFLLHGKQDAPQQTKSLGFKVAKVSTGTITRTIRLTGQTSARKYANISAPIPRGGEGGRASLILLRLVKAGSRVKKGDEVAAIDAQSTLDHIDDVMDTVKQAESDVLKRKAEQAIQWETLQQTLRQAKADMDKARLDAKPAGILTPIERELLELNVQQTEARYKELQKNTSEQQASFAAELRILEITAIRQRRHMERHRRDVVKFTMNAPMDGLAVMQPIFRGGDFGQVDQGDQLGPGQLFMKVVDPLSMQLEAKANQVETSELRIGQSVTIRLDAFPGLEFSGAVYSIGALATGSWMQNYYIRLIPVNISIKGSDGRLIPDLSASGDVVVEKQDNVLLIPFSAVRDRTGNPTVQVRDGDKFVERAVTLGIHNEAQIAVLSGLKAGDEVRTN